MNASTARIRRNASRSISCPAPAASGSGTRAVELDMLRGIAVIGIYWINVVIFGLPHGAFSWPHVIGEAQTANIAAWAFSAVFVEGTMRGLLSMLFGASALILLSETRPASKAGLQTVELYYRRCLVLMLFGLVHSYFLLSQWELLFGYGLLALFLYPLRGLSPGRLIVAGLVLFSISDINSWSQDVQSLQGDEDLSEFGAQQAAPTRDEVRLSIVTEMMPDVDVYRSGYAEIFTHQPTARREPAQPTAAGTPVDNRVASLPS